ncbi:hypothetical protein WI853_23095, partial [Salmonella enterica subsp. enterica serovar Corvallis]
QSSSRSPDLSLERVNAIQDGSNISKKPVLLYELFLEYGGEGGCHIYVHYQLTNFFWDFRR